MATEVYGKITRYLMGLLTMTFVKNNPSIVGSESDFSYKSRCTEEVPQMGQISSSPCHL
jgi:hypothetical protein